MQPSVSRPKPSAYSDERRCGLRISLHYASCGNRGTDRLAMKSAPGEVHLDGHRQDEVCHDGVERGVDLLATRAVHPTAAGLSGYTGACRARSPNATLVLPASACLAEATSAIGQSEPSPRRHARA